MKYFMLLLVVFSTGCEYKKKSQIETAFTLPKLEKVALHIQLKNDDDWCNVYSKYKATDLEFKSTIKRLKLVGGRNFPIVVSPTKSNKKFLDNWFPGPSLGGEQITSSQLAPPEKVGAKSRRRTQFHRQRVDPSL